MSTYDWTVEKGGTLGEGNTNTPVQYPRSGDDRDISTMNKGAASQNDNIDAAVATNSTGNSNVPRHADTPIDYEANDKDDVSAGKGIEE